MQHPSRHLLTLLLPLLAAAPLCADRLATSYREAGGAPGLSERGVVAACAAGEVHDDGIPEDGYGWTTTVTEGRYVDRFTPASYPFRYGELCICWVRSAQGADDAVAFEVVAYDDDGPSGAPGTLLGTVPAVASAVPTSLPGAFYTIDLSPLGLSAASGNVYLGARWNPSTDQNFFLCADQSTGTPVNGGRAWASPGPWAPTQNVQTAYRALLIRATAGSALIEVPTLDTAGLAALLLLLGASAIYLLRRRAT